MGLNRNMRFLVGIMLCLFITNVAISIEIDELPHPPVDAKPSFDPLLDKEALQGIEYTFKDEYDKALSLFDTLIQKYPDHPGPYFFKAATYQNWMGSYRINHFEDKLEYCVSMVIEKGEEALKRNDDPWIYFYLGSAYGFRGYNRMTKHNWIGAYLDGRKGISNFKKALELDSTLYDVFLGLGSYHYWRTAKSKFIRIVAFWIPDKRELGLRQIEFSIKYGRYCPDQASYVLVSSLVDNKEYDRAYAVLEKALSKREEPNISDLYYKGYLMAKLENWPEAESLFTRLFQHLENYEYKSYGFLAECKYWIAKSLEKQNHQELALQVASEAIAFDQKRNQYNEVEGPLDSYKNIKEQLLVLIKNLNPKSE